MEYQAKITQLIKEEEYKKFALKKYPNCDYLNLMPIELWNEIQSKESKIKQKLINVSFWVMLALILISFISFILNFNFNIFIYPAVGLFLITLVSAFIWNNFRRKKIFDKYWYFNPPFPIEKPHYYKEGDTIKININLELIARGKNE